MQTCIDELVQIYTSAYFDIGLFTKALEIIWAKPMYMKYIFLLITGLLSLDTLMVRRDSENCHLSLSAVCDCGIS